MQKREPSYTVGGNINWCSHYREQYECPLKKQRVTIGSSNPTPGNISREKDGSKDSMYPRLHCSAVYNSQDMEVTYLHVP